MAVEKRLMHYASFDTQSSEESTSAPSTEKQLILARELKAECEKLGFDSVELTNTGIVYAYLNANTDKKERLNVDEVNINNQSCNSHVYSWFYNVKKEIDNVNKMFGLDIKVRLNQPDQKGASEDESKQSDETV